MLAAEISTIYRDGWSGKEGTPPPLRTRHSGTGPHHGVTDGRRPGLRRPMRFPAETRALLKFTPAGGS